MKWEEWTHPMREICSIAELVEYNFTKLNEYTCHLVCQKQDCIQAEPAVAAVE
jgi:hypothetical protein